MTQSWVAKKCKGMLDGFLPVSLQPLELVRCGFKVACLGASISALSDLVGLCERLFQFYQIINSVT